MSDPAELRFFDLGFSKGSEVERERIIKLLESYFKPEEAEAIYPADYHQYLDIVSLIKGEQNG